MEAFNSLSLCSGSPGVVGTIITELSQTGCCPRCALRLLGEKKFHIYKSSSQELQKLVDDLCTLKPSVDSCDTSANSESKIQPCVLCLGILQSFCDEEFAEKISDAVFDAGFQFSEHICSLMLPPCLIIREHSLWLHLEESFPDVFKNCSKENVPTIKDIWKWTMGTVLCEKLLSPFEVKAQFDICITFNFGPSDQECLFLTDLFPETFQKRKTKKQYGWELFSRAIVTKALTETSNTTFKKYYSVPPTKPKSECLCESIVPSHKQIYLAGRYNKYSRTLSQTPWVIEGKKKTETSVEELICDRMIPHFEPDDYKFSSSGREDVDVRMLGTGRPFVIELINPHKVRLSEGTLKEIQTEVNRNTEDVAIRDLQIVPKEETSILKDGEIEKTKSYLARCWSSKPFNENFVDIINNTKDVKLFQKTPIRVLHRRSLAVRERTVYSMTAERLDDHHFSLHLSTQAGTYIKEFVHSDLGRTTPNLGTLLNTDCDILDLDVTSVDIDWPKRLDNDVANSTANGSNSVANKSNSTTKDSNSSNKDDGIQPMDSKT